MTVNRPAEDKEGIARVRQDRSAYSEDGVDLTLVRWMLSLKPAERLQVLQQHVRAILRLRHDNPHL